eukprot:TRINITY_DN1208_c0_g2_i1.p2 TRINITY_DN1208_c0_g2~~TRINITY_DN1208_c0_g2_i1.p2  ORF type:complete len:195 (-),score=30.25 TRINITY_DN1208_c0_g2_i1:311-895(-)
MNHAGRYSKTPRTTVPPRTQARYLEQKSNTDLSPTNNQLHQPILHVCDVNNCPPPPPPSHCTLPSSNPKVWLLCRFLAIFHGHNSASLRQCHAEKCRFVIGQSAGNKIRSKYTGTAKATVPAGAANRDGTAYSTNATLRAAPFRPPPPVRPPPPQSPSYVLLLLCYDTPLLSPVRHVVTTFLLLVDYNTSRRPP